MGLMMSLSQGELNNMIKMLPKYTPVANDNDEFIFKKLLLTLEYN